MELKNNSEIKTNDTGTCAAVLATYPEHISVACYCDWNRDGVFIRSRTFKSRKGAENFAALFLAGLRRWS
jgi:hypothetical protein